ncbi:MAG: (2Fe-2S)-binding protein [Pseudomonadota bacterium]
MQLEVNGRVREISSEGKVFVLTVLRDELNLCGTRFGCGEGECGACMVMVDGRAVTSCNLPLWSVEGKRVVTVEGLGTADAPHAIQSALIEEQAGQCGYCLSGIAVSAAALLEANPLPTRDEICAALDGNLCRCGSHNRIIRAVERAASALRVEAGGKA